MSNNDDFRKKLKQLGEETVRRKILDGDYNLGHKNIAQDFVDGEERARNERQRQIETNKPLTLTKVIIALMIIGVVIAGASSIYNIWFSS